MGEARTRNRRLRLPEGKGLSPEHVAGFSPRRPASLDAFSSNEPQLTQLQWLGCGGNPLKRSYWRRRATLVRPTALTRVSWTGNEAVGRMRCEAEQRKVGVIRSGIAPASTGQKNLQARYISGRPTVGTILQHATNASRIEGSTTQSVSSRNEGADSPKDHADGPQAAPTANHMKNTI